MCTEALAPSHRLDSARHKSKTDVEMLVAAIRVLTRMDCADVFQRLASER